MTAFLQYKIYNYYKSKVRAMIKAIKRIIKTKLFWPIGILTSTFRSYQYSDNYDETGRFTSVNQNSSIDGQEKKALTTENPLRSYFDSRKEGRGIWKWIHYFDIYDHHLHKFKGKKVNILEIGVYSGGSLEMWKEYFGENCYIYGVDIVDSCKVYENGWTKIFIGDQADRQFWKGFKREIPFIDIIIDDGGHSPEQQIVTLEEMLPHLAPGGVYICEDVHGKNWFSYYIAGLAHKLNFLEDIELNDKPLLASNSTQFQSKIHSIHQYPYLTVIEKNLKSVERFIAPKHGTEWQPFLK
jgi:hypothetical protein